MDGDVWTGLHGVASIQSEPVGTEAMHPTGDMRVLPPKAGQADSAHAVQASVDRISAKRTGMQSSFANLQTESANAVQASVLGAKNAGMQEGFARQQPSSMQPGEGCYPPDMQSTGDGAYDKSSQARVQQDSMGIAVGLPRVPQDQEYAEQILSDLAWAQGVNVMQGQQGMVGAADIRSFGCGMPGGGGGAHGLPVSAGMHRPFVYQEPSWRLAYEPMGNLLTSGKHGQAQMMGAGGGLGPMMGAGGSGYGMVAAGPQLMDAGSVGGKRSHGGMLCAEDGVLHGHVPMNAGSAQQEALMELARENLLLKHQLQVAGVELKRLRQTCNKFQQQQQQQHHHPQPQHQPQQQPQQQAQAPGDANKINQSRYWNDDEHERFLEAIQKYGHKDVKAIAAMVGTRNPTQVRTHAQKYFMRLARSRKQGVQGGLDSLDDHLRGTRGCSRGSEAMARLGELPLQSDSGAPEMGSLESLHTQGQFAIDMGSVTASASIHGRHSSDRSKRERRQRRLQNEQQASEQGQHAVDREEAAECRAARASDSKSHQACKPSESRECSKDGSPTSEASRDSNSTDSAHAGASVSSGDRFDAGLAFETPRKHSGSISESLFARSTSPHTDSQGGLRVDACHASHSGLPRNSSKDDVSNLDFGSGGSNSSSGLPKGGKNSREGSDDGFLDTQDDDVFN